jgi:hypothetical protein
MCALRLDVCRWADGRVPECGCACTSADACACVHVHVFICMCSFACVCAFEWVRAFFCLYSIHLCMVYVYLSVVSLSCWLFTRVGVSVCLYTLLLRAFPFCISNTQLIEQNLHVAYMHICLGCLVMGAFRDNSYRPVNACMHTYLGLFWRQKQVPLFLVFHGFCGVAERF